MVRALRLQSEMVGRPEIAKESPIAKVLVRTGVFHLDQPFDYLVPEQFSSEIDVGSRVAISFRNKKTEGFVIARSSLAEPGVRLSVIDKVIAKQFDADFLPLLAAWAKRWAASQLDILRFSAFDPVIRAKEVQTDFKIYKHNLAPALATKHARIFWQLPPLVDEVDCAIDLIMARLPHGRVLAIFPEERVLNQVLKKLTELGLEPAVLRSSDTKSNRYANFLAVQNGANLVIGTRIAALSPSKYISTIVWREDSEHHFEMHSPGWNSRDASLIRSTEHNSSLIFAGYVPSVEAERLIETGFLTVVASAGVVQAYAAPAMQGEILPSPIFRKVKSALKKGPVLFLVPAKGYGLAISCAKCRNVAKCECGGKLTKVSKNANPSCSLCSKKYSSWNCKYCNNESIRMMGRGIERMHEEIGKAFPNVRIYTSTADRELSRRVLSNSIVLATPGMAANQNFQLTVILDGHNNFRDMRAEERYYSNLFRYGALAESEIDVVTDATAPEISALTKWSSISLIKRINRERHEVGLPPFSRVIVVVVKQNGEKILPGFQAAIDENRLPKKTKLSYTKLADGSLQITLFSSIADMPIVNSFIYEYQKKRSISGKELIKFRVDPYSLG